LNLHIFVAMESSYNTLIASTVRKDADVAEVIKDNKSKMFNPSDIFPDTRRGKAALQKELARRTAVMSPGEHERIPRCENYTIPQLIAELEKCPHEEADREYIAEYWTGFKAELRDYYLYTSNSTEADFYKQLRLCEACVHVTVLEDFKQRNRQLLAHEIGNAPRSYYDKVADLDNSDETFYTIDMGTDYGEPFHEVIALKPHGGPKTTGYDVKQHVYDMKRPFNWIMESILASGSGRNDPRGSEVKQFCQKPRLDGNKKVIALGNVVGYFFMRCKGLEGVFESIANIINDDFAGTMDNAGHIQTPHNQKVGGAAAGSAKRSSQRKSSSTNKKKAKSSDGNESDGEDAKLILLNRLVGNQERASLESLISYTRMQISDDQKLLVMLEESMKTGRDELRDIERELRRDNVEEDKYCQDRFWIEANESYEGKKRQIEEVRSRVDERKEELKTLESQLKEGFDNIAADTTTTATSKTGTSPSKTSFALYNFDENDAEGSLNGSNEEFDANYQVPQMEELGEEMM
jgi:hypothetical protein